MLGKNMTNGNPDRENLKMTALGAGKESQSGKWVEETSPEAHR
jgi:hypothetical protein